VQVFDRVAEGVAAETQFAVGQYDQWLVQQGDGVVGVVGVRTPFRSMSKPGHFAVHKATQQAGYLGG